MNEDPAGPAAGHRDLTVIRAATMKPSKPKPSLPLTLDLLAKNLDLIRTLPATDVRRFAILSSAVLSALNMALLALPEADDKLLDIHEASIKLGMSKDYLYRNFRTLPFAVPVGKAKRFSSRGIERYLEQQKTD